MRTLGSKRLWLSIAVAVVFYLGPSSPKQAASAEKMIVCYGSLGGTHAPLWLAKEARLFDKHGLDVNLVYIPSSFQPSWVCFPAARNS
jgi:ABC-type nitrate/sulfonate/bicarbonate transport system substrate-binding protein